MSYGHADKIAAAAAGTPAAGTPPIDPTLYRREDLRRILADRDIAALYHALKDAGLTQRRIAELTGQSQSEVSEILNGRRVRDVTVLERICDGLGIPPELMGLSYGGHGAYGGQGTVVSTEEVIEMLRRHLIALGGGIAVGAPAAKLGELLKHLVELPDLSPVSLPSQLSHVHVMKVRDLARRLHEGGRAYGSDPEVSSAAAARASRLLDVPGAEPVKHALMIAVAELHIQAGWAGFDGGLYDRAIIHYTRALTLATKARDTYLQALALNWAGLATVEHGDPNEGLKLLQVGTATAGHIPRDEQRTAVVVVGTRAAVQAQALADSATALSRLRYPEAAQAADTALGKARELWQPTPADPTGDLDQVAARLELARGRLDAAERFAAASVLRWEGVSNQRARIYAGIVSATIYVRAGEPRGLQLAHGAVTAAAKLTSMRVRRQVEPLVTALEARPGADAYHLARMAGQVATTRV
jgi:transcriptional regulator with XRE-family HTH domain